MKKTLLTLITAGTLLSPVLTFARNSPVLESFSTSTYHTVFHYNDVRKALRGVTLTDAVIDGSIYPEIDRVHPFDRQDMTGSGVLKLTDEQAVIRADKVKFNRERNGVAVRLFCATDLKVTDPHNEAMCLAGIKN